MCPVSRCRRGLRRDPSGSALPLIPQSVSRGARLSRLHWFAFATACQVARPPGRIGPSFPGPPGTFTSRLPAGRSPFPPLDMTTTATGLLCWRDFHPQEWQLASLHRTFAPAVQREIFDKLCELAGPVAAPVPVEITASKNEAASRPASWEAIRVGDLVIAHESHEDGWWEAIVVAIEADQLVLRWRDYARMPCVRRGRLDVALLPPVDVALLPVVTA